MLPSNTKIVGIDILDENHKLIDTIDMKNIDMKNINSPYLKHRFPPPPPHSGYPPDLPVDMQPILLPPPHPFPNTILPHPPLPPMLYGQDPDAESNSKFDRIHNLINKIKQKNDLKNSNEKYEKEESEYYNQLNPDTQKKITEIETKIVEINKLKIPLRFRILSSALKLKHKAMIINKLEDLTSNRLYGGSEITKYTNWVNSLLKIPFSNYKKLPIDKNSNFDIISDYLISARKILDKSVYGHKKTKERFVEILAQWISNPDAGGNIIGIQGVMGNGKTTLVKEGIAKAINRPFAFITLGGASDSAFLEGHSYTYEGSTWGKIVDIVINCGCMNPVFYFDELDKVSDTPKGEEIINLLIHLTDTAQNNQFNDRYFNGIDIDLSKSLFIFSYNDEKKINSILLDRLININTDGFNKDDKIKIAQEYLLPKLYIEIGFESSNIIISDETIGYLIETYTGDEGGVRTLKKKLYEILSRLNIISLTKDISDKLKEFFDNNIITINNKLVDLLLEASSNKTNESFEHMYM